MEDFNPIRRWFAEWRGRWHNVNGTAVLRLGDAAGESKLSVRNSNDEEVFYFASNGTSNIEPVEGETGEALLRGGSRSLLGNLVVADGVTVDGVDISSFSSNTASWQSAHTASGQHDVLRVGADVEIRRAGANVAALGTGDSLQSSSFSSGAYGYRLGDDGNAEFNNIRARGEFAASVFRRSEISAAAGTLGVFPGASVVHADFTTPSAVASSVSASIRNETPTSGTASFSSEDILQVKTWNGTTFVNAYLKVNADPAPVAATGYTTYSLLLMNGSVSAAVAAGTAIVKTGTSSSGAAVLLSADGSVGSAPNMTIQTHTGVPWEPTVIARFGNLSGITDGVFGTLSGYGTYVAGNAYITGSINASGGQISGVLGIGTSGGIYQGTGTFASPTTGLKIWNASGVGRIAGYNNGALQWYAGTDGKLYAGGTKVQLSSSGVSIGSNSGVKGSAWAITDGYRFDSASSPAFLGLYSFTNDTVQDTLMLMNEGAYGSRIVQILGVSTSSEWTEAGVELVAQNTSATTNLRVRENGVTIEATSGGLNVGTTGATAGQIKASAGISGTTGTFSSTLSGKSGTFTGDLNVGSTSGGLNVGTTGATAGQIKASAGISGTTGTFSSTLGVTGASTLAALSATTGTFSSTLGVTGAATLAALSATTGTFSSTLSGTSGTFTGGLNVGSATGAAAGAIKASGDVSANDAAFTGGINVGSATGAATGEMKTSGNITATKASNPTLTLSSTASGGGSRLFFKMESQSNSDYFLAGYFADASPKRIQWHYNSDGTAGAVSVLSMTSSNQVGINVSSPSYTLDVNGTLRVTGASTLAALSATTGTFSSTLGVTGTGTFSAGLNVNTTGAGDGQIFVAGATTNGTQKALDIRNNASASGLTLRTVSISMFGVNEDGRIVAGNEGSGSGATGFLALYTRTSDALGAQEKVRISAAGLVGIGTSAPGYLLDVSGDARFTGGLNVGATGAADGTIKTTTGGNSVTINGTTSSLITINKIATGAQTSELLVQSNSTNVARFGWNASGYVDISALLSNNDIQLNPSGTGRVRSSGLLTVEGDGTGIASTVGISNVSNTATNSAGVGSIKFKGATSRDSSGFIKIYVGTTAYWVPFFSAVTG